MSNHDLYKKSLKIPKV